MVDSNLSGNENEVIANTMRVYEKNSKENELLTQLTGPPPLEGLEKAIAGDDCSCLHAARRTESSESPAASCPLRKS